MKKNRLILMLIFGFFSTDVFSQESKNERKEESSEQIQAAIESGEFEFQVNSATPSKGRVIQMTSGYHMSVSKEEIVSELPYFGRAFSGGYTGSDGGIKFTSKDFTYYVKPKKKSGWDVTLVPADVSNIVKIFISVTSSGHATLRITSTDRDAISYSGVIE